MLSANEFLPESAQAGNSHNGTTLDSMKQPPAVPAARDVIQLCNVAQDLFAKEGNVVRVNSPVTIVGDLHGQYHDLCELLQVGGSDECYLFLGDFVDRGSFSVETLVLLLTLKVKYPSRITLLRGNHESRQITQVYGFYDEIIRKYGNADVWVRCTTMFDFLPLAAIVVDTKTFAVHAGLSPHLETIDQLEEIERTKEVLSEGLICDLLWSDPANNDDRPSSSTSPTKPPSHHPKGLDAGLSPSGGWSVSPRGAGYVFGEDVVEQFNRRNDFQLIARSHQLVMKGFNELFRGTVTTVWSAPNYMNRCGNSGAILRLGEESVESRSYVVFAASPSSEHEERPLPDYFV